MSKKSEAAASSSLPDPVATQIETAFAAGNYAAVRRLAAGASTDAARAAAAARLPLVKTDVVQVLVGVIAMLVTLTVAAFTLHH